VGNWEIFYLILNYVIYPNPTNGQLTIKNSSSTGSLPGDGTLSVVEVYDIVGKLVYTSPNPSKGGEQTTNNGSGDPSCVSNSPSFGADITLKNQSKQSLVLDI